MTKAIAKFICVIHNRPAEMIKFDDDSQWFGCIDCDDFIRKEDAATFIQDYRRQTRIEYGTQLLGRELQSKSFIYRPVNNPFKRTAAFRVEIDFE